MVFFWGHFDLHTFALERRYESAKLPMRKCEGDGAKVEDATAKLEDAKTKVLSCKANG